jgi:hypothetical protein
MSGAPSVMMCVAEGCNVEFTVPPRLQGGGRHKKYCSPKCRSRDWARGNSMENAVIKERYASKPESKEVKAERNMTAKFAKYGVTAQWFTDQLARQRRSCAGCGTAITEKTARIDHCHTSGKVRGLLCDSCNWALGHAKDSPAILRRLMAYLHRDVSVPMVYVGGALKNPEVMRVAQALRDAGYDAMDEWITPGPDADSFLHAYEKQRGRHYAESLRGRAAENVVLFDKSYIDLSDAFVLVLPAGKSAYMELGYAAGQGIPTFILAEGGDPERFDVMPALAGPVVYTVGSLIEWLRTTVKAPQKI